MKRYIAHFLLWLGGCLSLLCAQQITEAEYFFDTDPGVGNGIPMLLSPGDSLVENGLISGAGLAPGYHYLYIRMRDDLGRFSIPKRHLFYVYDNSLQPDAPTGPIVRAEYFIDGPDPGPGNGHPLPVDTAQSVQMMSQIEVDSLGLPLGMHALTIRVQDSLGRWSLAVRDSFLVCTTYGPIAGFDYIQFGSTISILDSSAYAQTYSWNFGDDTLEDTVSHPKHIFELPGIYNITQTVSNACGMDSLSRTFHLAGVSQYSPHSGGLGDVTMHLYGAGFSDSTQVSLRLQGNSPVFPLTSHVVNPGNMLVLFDLRTQPLGEYDLWIEFQDTIQVFEKGFHLEYPVVSLHTQILGPSAIRPNIPANYFITVENTGNTDAVGVPLWIALSPETLATFSTNLVYPDDSLGIPLDSIPLFIYVDSLGGENYSANVYAFLVPYVPAYSTIQIPVNIVSTSPGQIRLLSWVDEPLYGSPLSYDQVLCIKEIIETVTDLTPQTACIYGVLDLTFSPMFDAVFAPERLMDTDAYLTNYFIGMVGVGIDCFNATNPLGTTASIVKQILEFKNKVDLVVDCSDAFVPPLNPDEKDVDVNVITSFDPNEKNGAVGPGIENFLSNRTNIQYSISFENVDTATAPAQIVSITDTLDRNVLALNSFELGPITISDTFVIPPPGLQAWTTDFPLRNSPLILRVNTRLDTLSGVVSWTFLSLDSASLEITSDALSGFLPPNLLPPEGEGRVSFSIQLNDSVSHATLISNQASIVFDFNEPIVTNIWTNTLDLLPPQSSMNPLPLITVDTLIELSWSGMDPGSGIESYDVFYAVNQSSIFQKWAARTDTTAALFTGQPDSTYYFYVVAYDKVGNQEIKASVAEAMTTVDVTTSLEVKKVPFSFTLYPNPHQGDFMLTGMVQDPLPIQYEVWSSTGQSIMKGTIHPTGTQVIERLRLPSPPPGIYLLRLNNATLHWSQSMQVLD